MSRRRRGKWAARRFIDSQEPCIDDGTTLDHTAPVDAIRYVGESGTMVSP
jgi:hypothetical protein